MSSLEDSLSETESSQFGSEDEAIKLEGTDEVGSQFEEDDIFAQTIRGRAFGGLRMARKLHPRAGRK